MAAYLLVEDAAGLAGRDVEPYVELPGGVDGPRVSVRRSGLETSQWLAGDLLIQQLNLTVPVDLPPGDHDLRFGLVPAPGASDVSPGSDHPTVQAATLHVRAAP
jgi:hypothetical protein